MLVNEHKARKQETYWASLIEGETGRYKALEIDRLIDAHMRKPVRTILDVGCGTSMIAESYLQRLEARTLVVMDYDESVIRRLKADNSDRRIEYRVGDIFKLDTEDGRYDLVFLLDMLHEVYSFHGRRSPSEPGPIDHVKGVAMIGVALAQIASVVTPGGGVVITDNILAEEDGLATVEIRSPQALAAVHRVVREYPSRPLQLEWISDRVMRLPVHHFCILLTQYNKIKKGLEDRWAVEQLEVHQYLRASDYVALFDRMGFDCFQSIGTPRDAAAEWADDFNVLDGLPGLPAKRTTCLAIRRL